MTGKGFDVGIRVYGGAFIVTYRRLGDGAMVGRADGEG
jgi:hypothetical protein